jgi:hypothetical protein
MDASQEHEWRPSHDQLRSLLGVTAALSRGDAGAVRDLTKEMSLYQGLMSCLVLLQMLLKRLAEITGKSVSEVIAEISLQLESSGPL